MVTTRMDTPEWFGANFMDASAPLAAWQPGSLAAW